MHGSGVATASVLFQKLVSSYISGAMNSKL